MVKNRLLLCSVAFTVSFSLSFLMSRNIKMALLTSLISVTATFVGIAVVNYKQRNQQKLTLTALERQIYQLKRWAGDLNQSLSASASEKQRTEVNLNFLKTQLSQLQTQIFEQRSNKQQLSQELVELEDQKYHLELECYELQVQIENYEQHRAELREYLRSIKVEKQNAESQLKSLQTQATEQEHQKEQAKRDLADVNKLKLQLEENLRVLQFQIWEFDRQNRELNQSLAAATQEKQAAEDINLLQLHIAALESTNIKQEAILTDEWHQFSKGLTSAEHQVLGAIINQTPQAIKNIAEANLTMPELLIDSINERALDTIGDLIVDPGNDFSKPKVIEEYLAIVDKIVKMPQMN